MQWMFMLIGLVLGWLLDESFSDAFVGALMGLGIGQALALRQLATAAPTNCSAFGPLLAAAIIIPFGQGNVVWFGLFALFAVIVTYGLSRWYREHLNLFKAKAGQAATHGLTRGRVIGALVVLGLLVFSKYFYMASLTSYFTFYLIEKFDLSVASSQLYLFLFHLERSNVVPQTSHIRVVTSK